MDDDMTPIALKRAHGGTHKVDTTTAARTIGIWSAVSARCGQERARGFGRPSSDDSMSAKSSSSCAIVRLVYMFSPYHTSGGSGSYPVCVSVSEPSACRLRNPHRWCVTGSPRGHPLCFDICRSLHDHIACTTAASSRLDSQTDL